MIWSQARTAQAPSFSRMWSLPVPKLSSPQMKGVYLPPGATPDDYDALARPEHRGRVLFCGEHTSRKYPATMHGALLSGEREAKRVLGDLGRG